MYACGALTAALAGFLFFAEATPLSHPPFSRPSFPYPSYKGYGDAPVVRTQSGTLVRGVIEADAPAVRQFLGIPYGAPPVGSLRWAPPQPAARVVEVNATELPVSCMQYLSNGSSVYTRDVLEFGIPGGNDSPMGEDCLTISVWTPAAASWDGNHGWQGNHDWQRNHDWHRGKQNAGLPVMLFIYGGGFTTGGVAVPYQIPAQWVQRSQDLIVVSFNYRLNIFGFPNAAGLNDQNLGLLDQRLAVEWVRDNIAAFGGDPSRITLWGQSAGAMSVDFYNFAHYDDPIVEGLIMDSASRVGCGNQADAAAELACMRGVPAQTLEQFVRTYQDSGATPGITFGPMVDGKVVFANYTERALEGKIANVPAIIGTNSEDGVPFAPYNPNGPNRTIAQQALLRVFFCPAVAMTRQVTIRLAAGRTTYRYEYDGNFTNISPRPWMGAYHSGNQAELPLLFGTHPNFRGNSTPFEYAVSAAMQDAWLAFDRDPSGGLAGQDWPAYGGPGGAVRIFGRGDVVAQTGDLGALEMMCNGVPIIAS